MLWIDLYGTDDCGYYEQRCLESGGPYYCVQAPFWCATFPRGPAAADRSDVAINTWSRCTRRCLQDCDRHLARAYCPAVADPRPDPFAWYGASLGCHGGCYVSCLAATVVAVGSAR